MDYYFEANKSHTWASQLAVYLLPENAVQLLEGVYVKISDQEAQRLYNEMVQGKSDVKFTIMAKEALSNQPPLHDGPTDTFFVT